MTQESPSAFDGLSEQFSSDEPSQQVQEASSEESLFDKPFAVAPEAELPPPVVKNLQAAPAAVQEAPAAPAPETKPPSVSPKKDGWFKDWKIKYAAWKDDRSQRALFRNAVEIVNETDADRYKIKSAADNATKMLEQADLYERMDFESRNKFRDTLLASVNTPDREVLSLVCRELRDTLCHLEAREQNTAPLSEFIEEFYWQMFPARTKEVIDEAGSLLADVRDIKPFWNMTNILHEGFEHHKTPGKENESMVATVVEQVEKILFDQDPSAVGEFALEMTLKAMDYSAGIKPALTLTERVLSESRMDSVQSTFVSVYERAMTKDRAAAMTSVGSLLATLKRNSPVYEQLGTLLWRNLTLLHSDAEMLSRQRLPDLEREAFLEMDVVSRIFDRRGPALDFQTKGALSVVFTQALTIPATAPKAVDHILMTACRDFGTRIPDPVDHFLLASLRDKVASGAVDIGKISGQSRSWLQMFNIIGAHAAPVVVPPQPEPAASPAATPPEVLQRNRALEDRINSLPGVQDLTP